MDHHQCFRQAYGLQKSDWGVDAGVAVKMLEEADVAYDIGAYRDAPAGLRIWCGATVNTEDLEALFPWIEYAFAECS